MSKETQRKSQSEDGASSWHDHVLAGIDPKDERRMLYLTRQRAKKAHGLSEDELDAAYGVGSRKR